ncbi:hypothetical protein [Paenibacillus medicaginis]|uniref:Uncharacterized protein n=1 Tax=Paenibacillus medicaginis TaxID=1470560 RepID=A0ABV5C6Y0_9BACL
MTDVNQGFSVFAKQLLKELASLSGHLTDKFADAVKDGADRSSEKIMEAVIEFAEPSSVLVEKLTTAVKEGENNKILEAVDGFIQPSSVLVHKISVSVKEGAALVGEKMVTALEDSVKPDPVDAKKFREAVKDGTSMANEKMKRAVEDFSEMIKAFKVGKG